MIKFILFDLDDTIIDFTKCEKESVLKAFSKYEIMPAEQMANRYSEINYDMWKNLERNLLSRDQLKIERFRILFEEFKVDVPPILVAREYEERLKNSYHLMENAEKVVSKLAKTYKLYIATNGTVAVQQPRIEKLDILKYFQDYYISEEMGANKPSKSFFLPVFESIPDFKKEECVIIGDSLTADVKGGNIMGIKTIWFNRFNDELPSEYNPDYVVYSLDEIPAILNKM